MECKNNPQVERLLWRVIIGAIPVSSNLERRGLPRFNCKACGAHEDDLHVFLNCPIAVEVWNQIPLAHKPLTSIPYLAMLIKQGEDYVPLPPTGLNAPLWPWVVWNLWKARNKLVFENRAFTAQEIVLKSTKDAKEWNDAQSVQKATTLNNFSPYRPPVCSSCPPPTFPADILVCNVDAAWNAVSGACGIGGIYSGDNVRNLPNVSEAHSHVSSALVAEALAVHRAVALAVYSNV